MLLIKVWKPTARLAERPAEVVVAVEGGVDHVLYGASEGISY